MNSLLLLVMSCLVDHSSRPSRPLSYIAWGAPSVGWTKLNSYGSVDNNRKASYGGLARDESRRFLGGFAVNLGFCPITVVEIWGAFYALDLAWSTDSGGLSLSWILLLP